MSQKKGKSLQFESIVEKSLQRKTFMAALFSFRPSADVSKYGVVFVFAAGVLWSTVGIGIRLIEDAIVWQILLYRSVSM